MRLQIKVNPETQVIEEAKFKTLAAARQLLRPRSQRSG